MINSKLIKYSIAKFDLNLKDKIVLTEAASGNYVVTPIIAALAGAKVYALTKDSKYASIKEVEKQTYFLAETLGVEENIQIITDYNQVDLKDINILTNTGFNRPINQDLINNLSSKCVIPLMWEPWEFRASDLDIEACYKKGIKVYGTNEADTRLKTMDYIGYIVLNFLLQNKKSPMSSYVLLLGDKHFGQAVEKVLVSLEYSYDFFNSYEKSVDIQNYNIIVFAEHSNSQLLLGESGFIKPHQVANETLLIHIAGNVDFTRINTHSIPKNPAPFGYMSFTTDFIDPVAIIDLHTAGLKVAEGMLIANKKRLKDKDYKEFLEKNYPALSFPTKKYW